MALMDVTYGDTWIQHLMAVMQLQHKVFSVLQTVKSNCDISFRGTMCVFGCFLQ